MFASGRVEVVMIDENGLSSAAGDQHKGCLVVWQLVPDMWLVELAVSGHQIAAGSDGEVAWRRTPWLGAHAARGGVRPLRRALQASGQLFLLIFFSFLSLHYFLLILLASG